jgi:hypothetical protein
MTTDTLRFTIEKLFSSQLVFSSGSADEFSRGRIQFGSREKVEHVLHLRHVAHLNAIKDIHPFLARMNFVAVKVRGALFEFREVLHGAQASLRTMNLLAVDASKAHGVQSKASFLRPHIGVR